MNDANYNRGRRGGRAGGSVFTRSRNRRNKRKVMPLNQ